MFWWHFCHVVYLLYLTDLHQSTVAKRSNRPKGQDKLARSPLGKQKYYPFLNKALRITPAIAGFSFKRLVQ